MKLKISIGLSVLGLLVACGGGDGGTVAAPPTASASGSNQLATKLPAISSLKAMALQTPSASQVSQWKNNMPAYAKVKMHVKEFTTALQTSLVPNAYAQTAPSSAGSSSSTSTVSTTCSVKNLVGLDANGVAIDLSLTAGTSSECIGVTDMFDGQAYVLLATEGIYKDGKTCNLVFAQKSTGSLFCLGEKNRSRYTFTRKDGSNWKKYDILQATDNGKYIFLETKVDVYDSMGSKTGELVKVLRFDLTDAVNGPTVMTVLEAENTSWYNWSSSGDTTWFTLYGYSGLENGDMAATYQYSINNYTFSSNNYINDSTYFAYNTSSKSFDSIKIDLSSLNTSSTSYWYQQIKCYLGGAVTTANGVDTSNFYFVADINGSKLYKAYYDGTNVVTQALGTTSLCANWYGSSAIAKIDGEYYGVTQNTQRVQNAWNWNTGQGQVGIDLYKRDLNASQDVVIAEMTTQRSYANPQLAVSSAGNKAYVVLGAAEQWIWNSGTSSSTRVQNGAEIFFIDLSTYSGTILPNVPAVVTSADKIWVSTLSNVGSDGLLQFAGRDMTTPMFSKIDVTVNPLLTQDKISRKAADSSGSGGETVAMVRL